MDATPIPVTIVTGFLGSGKTTLLNALLREPALSNSAVLINEFGEVQIDHDLVADFTDELVMTTTGCICCTASSDIKQSLFDLWEKQSNDGIKPFKRVIVETTGLMDPVPVINSLLLPPTDDPVEKTVSQIFVLSRVVTLFDIIFGPMALEQNEEALKQVVLADAILLTKTDLAQDPATLNDIQSDRKQLSLLNPTGKILDRQTDWAHLCNLFCHSTSYNLQGRGKDVEAWMDADRLQKLEPHDHSEHANMDFTRHSEDICSHVIILDQPVSASSLDRFLEYLKGNAGTDLLRLKAILGLTNDPDHPIVLHGIQHTIYPVEKLQDWPGSDRRSKFVLIGRNLDIDFCHDLLKQQ